MKMKILTLVLLILLVNMLTFVVARVLVHVVDGTVAIFDTVNNGGDGKIFSYLVAGNLNQPRAAFAFMDEQLQGQVTYLQFSRWGWDAKVTARWIVDEVKGLEPRQVNVYTISLGDHVARYLEDYLKDWDGELNVIPINPCTDIDFVLPPLGVALTIGAPVFELVCHGLGWLSLLPIIPTPGGNYSLILLADQYWSIAFDRPPYAVTNTLGVVCSYKEPDSNDGLLSNAAIKDYFSSVPVIVDIETNHGDTIGAASVYLDAMEAIWEYMGMEH